ncbi:disintegrin and metalloproteinase domain-containing protein 28 [Alosa sapidissima]|uniref:disintegrin and metalloproteinase domain-containing protein 28 n=1 Tax=Alosa sapidissima TaxID=34773 RepID=UPI001C086D1D|nr:disintegrin and metalloproteinase domain-containing protein 28 [Alosa sapidissima]
MASKRLLLWILSLAASLDPSVCTEFNGVKVYDVVRPIRLHSLSKRAVESSRPEVLKYGMTLKGKDIELNLERNDGILTKEYSETYYTDDGTPVTSAPEDLDHCYYHGSIVNDSESMVSVSTCDGLRGYIQTAEQKFLIEPMTEDKDGDHALLKFDDVHDKPMTCGVTNTSWDPEYPAKTSRAQSRGARPSLLQQQKYIELYLVADNREYIRMKKDISELRKRIFEIINFVNGVYKSLNTFIALTGLEVWTDSDKISVTPPAGATLDGFTKWRNSDLKKRKRHDNAQLITGIDFDGSTVGLAFIGTLCSDHSTGVVQDHNHRAVAVGATLSHEMGHNLGMSHDTSSCVCPDNSCIMAAALSYTIPQTFSSCSSTDYSNFLGNRNPECVLNKPDYKELVTEPVCGNGFLERGEQCDCGTVVEEECTNPCCNATNCRLVEGAQCAEGDCCENCKIMSPNRECRPKHDDCDLPEYCTGKSTECPEDVFTVNGLPCENGKGYCYNGQCPQMEEQCIQMWGGTARVGREFCFNQNTRGIYYGFCKRPSKDVYEPCQKEDIMCGKLFCHDGNGNPNYGRLVAFSDCKATFYGDPETDRGQVDTGTKCGEGMVCNQNQCVNLVTAYRVLNCSAKCPGHGVCNHRSECQCEPGWLPPHCDSKDPKWQLSKEGVTAIAVIFSLLGLIIVIGASVFMWKRRQNSSPGLPAQKSQPVSKPVLGRQPLKTPKPNAQATQRPNTRPPPPPSTGRQSRPVQPNFMAAREALRPPPRV